jgi:hypothetical protein
MVRTVFQFPACLGQACQGVPHVTSPLLVPLGVFASHIHIHATGVATLAICRHHHSRCCPQAADNCTPSAAKIWCWVFQKAEWVVEC